MEIFVIVIGIYSVCVSAARVDRDLGECAGEFEGSDIYGDRAFSLRDFSLAPL